MDMRIEGHKLMAENAKSRCEITSNTVGHRCRDAHTKAFTAAHPIKIGRAKSSTNW
jgi:hypothetical protein